ncbi:hypothetical protein ACIREE_28020 [Streptomyces sp. NPDC102467]|uniref:hypothetical protein n=1 Tax=Streptomyces sp. NPDC102467 TaxID=3366179 RepID=UPI003802AF77
MCSMKSRAVSLAAQLAALTGDEVRVDEAASHVRVTCAVPPHLAERSRRLLLIALAGADRYGHDATAQGAHIWAEIAADGEQLDADTQALKGS